ncbi:hypothetical protein LXA43DRAFT_192035 [Ganoderma leucocontextum]|nr:hypothetical protein LXA43DRAFT_192035 [Ganoderma leucocontextum]
MRRGRNLWRGAEHHPAGMIIRDDERVTSGDDSQARLASRLHRNVAGGMRSAASREVIALRRSDGVRSPRKTCNISNAGHLVACATGVETSTNIRRTNARCFSPPARDPKIDANGRFHCISLRPAIPRLVPSASRPGSTGRHPRHSNRSQTGLGRRPVSPGMASELPRWPELSASTTLHQMQPVSRRSAGFQKSVERRDFIALKFRPAPCAQYLMPITSHGWTGWLDGVYMSCGACTNALRRLEPGSQKISLSGVEDGSAAATRNWAGRPATPNRAPSRRLKGTHPSPHDVFGAS